MKRRSGLVSNSSSSSYIVAISKSYIPTPCPTCGQGGHDIIELLEDSRCDETVIRRTGDTVVEDLKKRIEALEQAVYTRQARLCEVDELEERKRILEKIDRYRNDDWDIFDIEIDYLDVLLTEMFDVEAKTAQLVILLRS